MEAEKMNLELSSRNRRMTIDVESQAKVITELRQRAAGLQESFVEERSKVEKHCEELEGVKKELNNLKNSKNDEVHGKYAKISVYRM